MVACFSGHLFVPACQPREKKTVSPLPPLPSARHPDFHLSPTSLSSVSLSPGSPASSTADRTTSSLQHISLLLRAGRAAAPPTSARSCPGNLIDASRANLANTTNPLAPRTSRSAKTLKAARPALARPSPCRATSPVRPVAPPSCASSTSQPVAFRPSPQPRSTASTLRS